LCHQHFAVKENNKQPAFTKDKTKTPVWATLEDIRAIAGYRHLSDGEALDILASIRQFVSLMANFIQKKHEHE
jgi:hypothetical protein